MRPIVRPELINEPFGDPGLYLDFLFEKRALLVDLGDLHALAPRKLLRVSHAFVSHTHMDHFSGFDSLLRVSLGREKRLEMFGPAGFAERVAHKLGAYSWNLVQNFETNLVIAVTEVHAEGRARSWEFECRSGFEREPAGSRPLAHGVLVDEDAFRVRAAVLDHDVPCLAFALEEKRHVNVLKDRLLAMGFRVGPWLKELKAAVLRGDADETPVRVWWRDEGRTRETERSLGELKREMLRIVPGEKIAYVTDVRYHEENAREITDLARDADLLFIETPFLEEDRDVAARKNHLTADQAGRLARMAGARKLVPFHFSPRYAGREDELRREAEHAFSG
jgi:ribonuclease Z